MTFISRSGSGNSNGRIRRFNRMRARISAPSWSESEASRSRSSSSPESDDESDRDQDETAPSNSIINGVRSNPERALLSVTLTDPSILDCPICSGFLVSPVHQCINGHIACSSCCTKMANKCPYCRCPTGLIRCRVLEKILESVAVNCINKLYGCTETFKRYQKQNQLDHEKICCYNPCTCPYEECSFIGMPKSLYKHFGDAHNPSMFSFDTTEAITLNPIGMTVFLQDSGRSCLFVLERAIMFPGSYVSVTCVGPDSMNREFSYDLTAVIDSHTRVEIKADVMCVRKWIDESFLGKYLLLPGGIVSRRETLKVELIIRRNPTSES